MIKCYIFKYFYYFRIIIFSHYLFCYTDMFTAIFDDTQTQLDICFYFYVLYSMETAYNKVESSMAIYRYAQTSLQ